MTRDEQGSSSGQPYPFAAASARNSQPRRIARLALKELRETLRDRRTIITLLLMPVLVYPLLSVFFQRFLLSSFRGGPEVPLIIGIQAPQDLEVVSGVLNRGSVLLGPEYAPSPPNEHEPAAEGTAADAAMPPGTAGQPTVRLEVVQQLEQAVSERRVDLGIRTHADQDSQLNTAFGPPLDWELIFIDDSSLSRQTLEYVELRLQAVNEEFTQALLVELGLPPRAAAVEVERKIVPDATETSTFSLAAAIPLILILMTITGAVYPAIDLTAGERERGTLETLVAAPVPRLGLLVAKYAAVVTVALLTATVNLVAMTVTVYSVNLGPVLFGEHGLTLLEVVQVFCLLALFAAFFSAVLLALTSFARSFKEAQAYLIPLMLVSLAPGLLTLMPGVRLTGLMAVVPLANVALLAREVLQGTVNPIAGSIVVLSTALYAIAALALAARIFGTDAILYGSEGSWSDLFHRPQEQQATASVTTALFCLALMFPAHFLLVQLLGQFAGESFELRLLLQSALSALLFVAVPLIAAEFGGVRVKSGFRLKPAPALAFVGAVVLGLSLWPFVFEIVLLLEKVGVVSISSEQLQWGRTLINEFQNVHPAAILVGLAIVPAMVEEFFFRGFLLTAFRRQNSAWRAILYSAILFGLFHLIVRDALAIERLLPSTLLGIVLGWVCERTGSVLPGMLLHACHNGTLLMISRYEETLKARGWGAIETDHLPTTWLLAAVVVGAVGFGLMALATRRSGDDSP